MCRYLIECADTYLSGHELISTKILCQSIHVWWLCSWCKINSCAVMKLKMIKVGLPHETIQVCASPEFIQYRPFPYTLASLPLSLQPSASVPCDACYCAMGRETFFIVLYRLCALRRRAFARRRRAPPGHHHCNADDTTLYLYTCCITNALP